MADVDAPENPLSSITSDLLQKRSATRRAALDRLRQLLERYSDNQYLEGHVETLLDRLSRGVTHNEPEEGVQCLHSLGLLVVSEPDMLSNVVRSMYDPFRALLLRVSTKPALRAAIARFFGLVGLLAPLMISEPLTEKIMEMLDTATDLSLKNKTAGEDEATAALTSAWAVVASTMDVQRLAGDIHEAHLNNFTALITHASLPVRAAALHALGLLVEAFQTCREEGLDRMWNGKPKVNASISHDELLTRVKEMEEGVHTQERVTKQAIHDLGASLTPLVDTLEAGLPPDSSFKLSSLTEVSLQGWAAVIQHRAVHAQLAGGYYQHMANNELFWHLFDYDGDDGTTSKGRIKLNKAAMIAAAEARKRDQETLNERSRKAKYASKFKGDQSE